MNRVERADALLATATRHALLVQRAPSLRRKLGHLTQAALAYCASVLLDPFA